MPAISASCSRGLLWRLSAVPLPRQALRLFTHRSCSVRCHGWVELLLAVEPQQEEQRLRGVSRSLVIAVGGTGHKIILDLRQRLLQKYGSLDRLPIVSFLLLDTDQAIFGKNPNYSDAANLDNADKIHTSVHGVEQLRRNLKEYPHLRDWLDPRTLSGDIHQGAGAVRARGRLAYFWNYDTIARRIEEQYADLVLSNPSAAGRVAELIRQGYRLVLALRVVKVVDRMNEGGR